MKFRCDMTSSDSLEVEGVDSDAVFFSTFVSTPSTEIGEEIRIEDSNVIKLCINDVKTLQKNLKKFLKRRELG